MNAYTATQTAAQYEEIIQDNVEPPTRKGRPRSEKSRKKILDSTNKLLLHMSVQELSIEAIAKKAKVGKTTIYRWWPNKAAVVMDALVNQPGMQTPMPVAQNNTQAIRMQIEKLTRLLHSNNGQTIAQLFSEAQGDEASLKIFEDGFLGPLIDAIEYSILQGQEDGEFRTDIDIKLAVDMICGPLFFRLLAHPQDFNDGFDKTYPMEALTFLQA